MIRNFLIANPDSSLEKKIMPFGIVQTESRSTIRSGGYFFCARERVWRISIIGVIRIIDYNTYSTYNTYII